MTLRRFALAALAVAGAVLLGLTLYLAFGDLGRHKPRLESLVSDATGRPFAIDGAFELRVLPSISVLAERVRVGNAPWGAAPQMAEIGRFSAEVGVWSLLFGPVDIRSLELRDVSVFLERNPAGEGNWEAGDKREPAKEPAAPGEGVTEVSAVILHARLENVAVSYRAAGEPVRAARLEALGISIGPQGLLAMQGRGTLDRHPFTLKAEAGPVSALVVGRNLRLSVDAALDRLEARLRGTLGRLDPLAGADLTLEVGHPDTAALLKSLGQPAFASGALAVQARLTAAQEGAKLDLDAKTGDITVQAEGSLRTLGLAGASLKLDASIADAARAAKAFGAEGLPTGALKASARVAASREEIKLEAVSVEMAGAKATAAGTVGTAGETRADLRFGLRAGDLAKLRPGLPAVPLAFDGSFASGGGRFELKDAKGHVAKSEFALRAAVDVGKKRHVDAELSSPRIDLNPILERKPGRRAQGKPKEKYVFTEAPLPLGALRDLDARVRVTVGELVLAAGSLKEVDATLSAAGGKVALESGARGGVGGSLRGTVRLAPAGNRGADLAVEVEADELRLGLGAGGEIAPGEVPGVRMDVKLRGTGASARQLASGASGTILVAAGPGKVRSGLTRLVAGDLLDELAGKLNPFAAEEPYTQLECAVVRGEVVDGQAALAPILMQTDKVAVVAGGEVDLRTEKLKLDFSTRPRTGIGISAGMFATPFIEIAGTLAGPRLGVGAKGAAAGAAAAFTGGATVLAQGLFDRARGERDLCAGTLGKASATAK